MLKRLLLIFGLLFMSGTAYALDIQVSVTSADAILDGTPRDFDLKQFTSRLEKALTKKITDQGKLPAGTKLSVSIDSMGHKLRPFHFKSQYVAKYSYSITDQNKKTIMESKDDQVNEDQIDLIDEIVEEITDKILAK